jgi:anthranilate synthase component 2/para-aminobenzoate synthetase component 2
MITLIDHRDSFTRNLEHMLARFDKVRIIDRKSFSDSDLEESQMLVFSPGPGTPQDYPESLVILENAKGKIPILGVCLGFQMILDHEGAQIIRQNQVLHGVETEILAETNSITYHEINGPIQVGRYHSLQVDPDSLDNLPDSIKITATDPIRKTPLSFEDLNRKLFGLQYHPESFLSNQGTQILSNIIHESMEQR